MNAARRAELAAAFARQAAICAATPAPLYAELCGRCAEDIAHDGPVGQLIADFVGDPAAGSLPLRVLAAVHAVVLAGRAPALSRHYPSVGGSPVLAEVWPAFAAVIAAHGDELRPWLDHPPQTNEVGRSAMLFAGLAVVASRNDAPVQLLELGASGGLNLRFDRFHYRLGDREWGDPAATVRLRPRWRGGSPPAATLRVCHRRGCDLRPLDVRADAVAARLCAFVWTEHVQRLTNLRAAIAVARGDDLHVEAGDAAVWLPAALGDGRADTGTGTVVFHSSVWGYLPQATKAAIEASIRAAATTATPARPLHWLRWEDPPGSTVQELRLRSWPQDRPGDDDALLARGHAHAHDVEWLA